MDEITVENELSGGTISANFFGLGLYLSGTVLAKHVQGPGFKIQQKNKIIPQIPTKYPKVMKKQVNIRRILKFKNTFHVKTMWQ